jgi:hypothetical protein
MILPLLKWFLNAVCLSVRPVSCIIYTSMAFMFCKVIRHNIRVSCHFNILTFLIINVYHIIRACFYDQIKEEFDIVSIVEFTATKFSFRLRYGACYSGCGYIIHSSLRFYVQAEIKFGKYFRGGKFSRLYFFSELLKYIYLLSRNECKV